MTVSVATVRISDLGVMAARNHHQYSLVGVSPHHLLHHIHKLAVRKPLAYLLLAVVGDIGPIDHYIKPVRLLIQPRKKPLQLQIVLIT